MGCDISGLIDIGYTTHNVSDICNKLNAYYQKMPPSDEYWQSMEKSKQVIWQVDPYNIHLEDDDEFYLSCAETSLLLGKLSAQFNTYQRWHWLVRNPIEENRLLRFAKDLLLALDLPEMLIMSECCHDRNPYMLVTEYGLTYQQAKAEITSYLKPYNTMPPELKKDPTTEIHNYYMLIEKPHV